jgi:hypothetical protein
VRRALNDNPVVQIAVLGVLAVVVAFLLLTRMHKSGGSAPTPGSTSATATSSSAGSTSAAPGSTSATAPTTTAPSSTAPATSAGAVPPAASTGEVPTGKLVAGPGLPGPVAAAYADNKAIVLFVFRHRGIDDAEVRSSVERLRGRGDLAVFITEASRIARFSRITEGVNVNRVPALVVVSPRKLTHGTPSASVSYGFRGPDTVDQAVRDALYNGPTNLPYYP